MPSISVGIFLLSRSTLWWCVIRKLEIVRDDAASNASSGSSSIFYKGWFISSFYKGWFILYKGFTKVGSYFRFTKVSSYYRLTKAGPIDPLLVYNVLFGILLVISACNAQMHFKFNLNLKMNIFLIFCIESFRLYFCWI